MPTKFEHRRVEAYRLLDAAADLIRAEKWAPQPQLTDDQVAAIFDALDYIDQAKTALDEAVGLG